MNHYLQNFNINRLIARNILEDGKCIIVVRHSGEIKKYADVVYTIEDGKIIGDNCED